MLRVMRKHQRSFVIYVFLGIIIAVFVINFGPQSAGCTATTSRLGKIAGMAVTVADFEYAQAVWGMKSQQGTEEQLIQLRALVMDSLIARELLAEDAIALGLEIPPQEIGDMILRGRYLALGEPRPLIRGDDGEFDYDRFSRYVRYYWGVTPRRFREQQRRELLADKMRQVLRNTVKVSADDVEADYIHRNTQVKLQYVRFPYGEFESESPPTPAALKKFIADNKKRIEEEYDKNKSSFTKQPRQLKLQLLAKRWTGPAQKPKAEAQIKGLLQRLRGGADFAQLAQAESEDPSRSAGGHIGWRDAADPGLGPTAGRAVGSVKKGQLSDAFEDKDRFLVVRVLDERQGDLTLAQVEEEIALRLIGEEQSANAAKEAVRGVIKRVQAGEKLAEIFTVEKEAADEPSGDTDEGQSQTGPGRSTPKDADAPPKKGESAGEKSARKLATTAFFSKDPQNVVPRIGISKEIMEIAFRLKKGDVADRPLTVGKTAYLIAVADRKDPDLAAFEKQRAKLIEESMHRKAAERIREYTHERCMAALKSKEIDIASYVLYPPGYLEQQRKAGKAAQVPGYAPCQTLGARPFGAT